MDLCSLWDDYGIVSDILPFTYEFPRANIHELIAPDLLHQLIKGTFKNHLVTWVNEYLELSYTPAEAAEIITDIDRRIAAVPPFWGLRQFPEGRGFKQWTGDDLKALMKLAAARVDFEHRGMLCGSIFDTVSTPPAQTYDDDDDDEAVNDGNYVWGEVLLACKPITSIPLDVHGLAAHLNIPNFSELIMCFLYQQRNPDFVGNLFNVALHDCASPCMRGMLRERIQAVPSWRRGPPRYDCIFVSHDDTLPGFRGLLVAQVWLFFTITQEDAKYSCALVSWFSTVGEEPCSETGMWMVEVDRAHDNTLIKEVIHTESILWGAHLIGHAGED
ncbi:hypothetical protein H0H92_003615 [Tricholoma furcatifolium]|nr:hypothetical protein H0H92_003615 [Tricholoma furcatifolium]